MEGTCSAVKNRYSFVSSRSASVAVKERKKLCQCELSAVTEYGAKKGKESWCLM